MNKLYTLLLLVCSAHYQTQCSQAQASVVTKYQIVRDQKSLEVSIDGLTSETANRELIKRVEQQVAMIAQLESEAKFEYDEAHAVQTPSTPNSATHVSANAQSAPSATYNEKATDELFQALRDRNEACAKDITRDVSVLVQDKIAFTQAVLSMSLIRVKVALGAGADPNATHDDANHRPIFISALGAPGPLLPYYLSQSIIEVFFSTGKLNIGVADTHGNTALILAAKQWLGPDDYYVLFKNSNGVHLKVQKEAELIIGALLALGAQRDHKNHAGESFSSLCKQSREKHT